MATTVISKQKNVEIAFRFLHSLFLYQCIRSYSSPTYESRRESYPSPLLKFIRLYQLYHPPTTLESSAPDTMAPIMLRPTATQKPISAHLPTALALIGVVFCHDRNRIRPTRGMRKDRMFRPVEGVSTSTFLLATAQPQKGQIMALSRTSLPQLLQYFMLFALLLRLFSGVFTLLE